MASSPFGFGPLPAIRRSVIDPATGNVTQGPQTPPSALDLGGAYLDLLAGRAKDAITAPQRALSGDLQIWDPATGHTTDAANEAAGGMAALAMTGSLPMSRPAGSLGTFAGRLSKTADTAALSRAEQLAASGADRTTIWNKTGWFQGADGKWRYEISDEAAKIGPKALEELTASGDYGATRGTSAGVLHHGDLYRAYPELRGIDVDARYNSALSVPDATYHDPAAGSGQRPRIDMRMNSLEGEYGPRSIMLHEMQHGIQDAENFARGGNPVTLAERMPDPAAINDARVMSAIAQRGTPQDEVGSKFMEMLGRDPHPVGRDLFRSSTPEELVAMPSDGVDAYKRLAGEVEARNVQARRKMTEAERYARPPWLTQDVPDEQQIVNLGRIPSPAFNLGPLPRKGF